MVPRKRPVVGIVAFVITPGVVLGGGLWTASYAISRAIGQKPAAVCQPVSVQAPLQNSFKVNVVNASSTSGAATAVAKELPLRDFVPGTVGNDVTSRQVSGQGEIRHGPAGLDQALVVRALLLPEARLVPDYREGAAVDLVVGPQFTQLRAPEEPLVRRTDVVVNVYNTTYFDGLAGQAAGGLGGFGFKRGAVGFDPKNAWVTAVAAVRHGPDGLLGAGLVAEAVPGATLQLDAARKGTAVDLLIGMKWAGLAKADALTPQSLKKPLTRKTVERPCAL